ncbi:MAG: hypothetical protein KIT14_16315 [bacterium]|nr:hypothetical protein [bacterium]
MPHRARLLLAASVAALLAFAPAPAGAKRAPKQLKVSLPAVRVPANANVEECWFVRLPVTQVFDVGEWSIRVKGSRGTGYVQHFLVYQYQGQHLSEFATQAKRLVSSRACLDLGPVDRDDRQLIAAGSAPNVRGMYPPGVALALAPTPAAPDGIGILLSANLVNQGARPKKMSAKVIFKRAKPGTVRARLRPILDRSAEAGLRVPPVAQAATEDLVDARWRPAADACVLEVTANFHRRGLFMGVDHVDAEGSVLAVDGGTPNPYVEGRTHLFGTFDYTDPGTRRFARGLLVRAGEGLRFGCWHENGLTTPVRLGCEEALGAAPGTIAGGPAKPCIAFGPSPAECPAADPAWPGRTFTGACVAANVVAGPTADDERCALVGFYWDAVPGVAPEAACDASALPPLE